MAVTRRRVAFLSLGALAFYAAPINAAPPPAVFKDEAGNVYVHTGVTAGARVDVDLVGTPLTRKIRAGYCGQITLSPSTSVPNLGNSVTVGTTNINLAGLTTPAVLPKCVGNAFEPAATGHFKTPDGRYTLTGYTPGVSYDVKFIDVPASGNATVNGCSFAVIRNTPKRPLPAQIKINGTAHNVASLPVADPPICRRNSVSGVSTRYVPASW
jgi:hypothetical protein